MLMLNVVEGMRREISRTKKSEEGDFSWQTNFAADYLPA